MTREEEIEKASKEFAYNVSSIRPELNVDSFKQGTKWADKTMIEKACKWLQTNIDNYSRVVIDVCSKPIIELTEDFENDFKQAMFK